MEPARPHRYCPSCHKPWPTNSICVECRSKIPYRHNDQRRPQGRRDEGSPLPDLENRIVRLEAAYAIALGRIASGLTPEPLTPYPRDDSDE